MAKRAPLGVPVTEHPALDNLIGQLNAHAPRICSENGQTARSLERRTAWIAWCGEAQCWLEAAPDAAVCIDELVRKPWKTTVEQAQCKAVGTKAVAMADSEERHRAWEVILKCRHEIGEAIRERYGKMRCSRAMIHNIVELGIIAKVRNTKSNMTLSRLMAIAKTDGEIRSKIWRAQAWLARHALINVPIEKLGEGEAAWLMHCGERQWWNDVDVQAALELTDSWPWSSHEPPFRTVAAAAKAGKGTLSREAWAGAEHAHRYGWSAGGPTTMEAIDRARVEAPSEVAQKMRALALRWLERVLARAKGRTGSQVSQDIEGEVEKILSETSREWKDTKKDDEHRAQMMGDENETLRWEMNIHHAETILAACGLKAKWGVNIPIIHWQSDWIERECVDAAKVAGRLRAVSLDMEGKMAIEESSLPENKARGARFEAALRHGFESAGLIKAGQ